MNKFTELLELIASPEPYVTTYMKSSEDNMRSPQIGSALTIIKIGDNMQNKALKSKEESELITVEGINYRHCEDGHQHVLYQGHTCPMCVVRVYMQDCYDGIFKND